jgi:hypothetical protein
MKKGALELSVNFIAGIILGMLFLILGFAFFGNILVNVGEIIEQGLPNMFEQYAQDCVDRGERVCVPIVKEDVRPGKYAVFGVVVNNNLGSTKEFKPVVTFSIGQKKDGTIIDHVDISKWTFTDFPALSLGNNMHDTRGISFRVPPGTAKGTYNFNINVCYDDGEDNGESSKCNSQYPDLYGVTHQVSITVI